MRKHVHKYLLWFLVLVYVSGAIGFLINPAFFKPFTPYTLVLTSLVFLIHQPLNKPAFILGFSGIALAGYVSEVIGVKTGLVFGNYHYGYSLGYKVMAVPLVISLNWALLVICGILIITPFTQSRFLNAVFSAGLITAIDLLIEKVAPVLDFWYFKAGQPGIHNYLGWFIIIFITSYIFHNLVKNGNTKIAYTMLALQIFFFGCIYLVKLFNFI